MIIDLLTAYDAAWLFWHEIGRVTRLMFDC